jgi:hypothetical protein
MAASYNVCCFHYTDLFSKEIGEIVHSLKKRFLKYLLQLLKSAFIEGMMTWDAFRAFLIQTYAFFGLIGSLLIMFSMLVSALFYRGKKGENYSVFNHYISELGEVGVSRLSLLFNLGLIIGGLTLIPFLVGMGLALGNLWGKIAMIVGIWTALSCTAVGIFPMNNMKSHYWVALSYFRSGLVTVLLFSIAVFAQSAEFEIIPKISNLAGLFSVGCFAAFLLTTDTNKKKDESKEEALDPESLPERPRFWKTTILEWAVFFSTIVWFLVLALFALK